MSTASSNFRRMAGRLLDRVMMTVGRCVLTAINDKTLAQEVQVGLLPGELRDAVEHFQQYGYKSVPEAGAEGVAVFIGGNRDHGFVIATVDRRYRPTGWNPGEVGLYSKFDQFIRLKEDGSLVISAPNGISIETPAGVKISGKTIENAAEELFEHGTNGYGQKWIYDPVADEWRTDSFTLDPLPPETGQVVAGGTFPVTPPEVV